MAFQLGNAYGKVTVDARGVKSGVAEASNSLLKLTDVGKKLGQGLTQAGQALTVGVTLPILAFGAASLKAAADAETAQAELNAVIKSTGGIAGVTAKEVNDYAAAMQKLTLFDDEAIIGGQSMLLTFTKIGHDVFPAASTAMLNMAQKFGSIEAAATQLGKALNDPIEGVGALRRVGVMLSEQQEKQIKDFMAVNDIASAQKIILQELEVEFGGLAEAAGKTPEGQWVQFLNKIGDVSEVVGKILLPALLNVLAVLSSLMDAFLAAPEWLQTAIVAFGLFLAAIGPILIILGQLLVAVSTVAGAWPTLVLGFNAVMAALPGIGAAFTAISTAITGSLIPAITAALVAAAPIILTIGLIAAAFGLLYLAWTTDFLGFQTTLKQLAFIIQFYFNQGLEGARKSLAEAAPAIGKGFQSLADKVKSGMMTLSKFLTDAWRMLWELQIRILIMAITPIVNYIVRLRDQILTVFRIDWGMIGRNIIAGIISGIVNGVGALVNAVKNAAMAALNAAKEVLGIHSESTAFKYLGKMSGLGYMNEFARTVDPKDIANTMQKTAQPSTVGGGNLYQTNNFASGLTMSDVKRLIDERDRQFMNMLGAAFEG